MATFPTISITNQWLTVDAYARRRHAGLALKAVCGGIVRCMVLKVLVTGGSGFIGSALIRFLIGETDAEIVNVDKLTYAATPGALADVETDRPIGRASCRARV